MFLIAAITQYKPLLTPASAGRGLFAKKAVDGLEVRPSVRTLGPGLPRFTDYLDARLQPDLTDWVQFVGYGWTTYRTAAHSIRIEEVHGRARCYRGQRLSGNRT